MIVVVQVNVNHVAPLPCRLETLEPHLDKRRHLYLQVTLNPKLSHLRWLPSSDNCVLAKKGLKNLTAERKKLRPL